MSRNTATSDAKVVQEGLHLVREDGTLIQGFDPRHGKWGAPGGRQEMAFDPKTGKLVVTASNPDNYIAVTMAASGFFYGINNVNLAPHILKNTNNSNGL